VTEDALAVFRGARYLEVTTFRRDGSRVSTPVWFVADGDRLLAWTAASSGKVRRLRADPRAELAPCTMRGKALHPPVPGRGVLLPASDGARVHRLLNRKYPVAKRALAFAERVRHALRGRRGPAGADAFLAFTVDT
jgi:uncharacterized protein